MPWAADAPEGGREAVRVGVAVRDGAVRRGPGEALVRLGLALGFADGEALVRLGLGLGDRVCSRPVFSRALFPASGLASSPPPSLEQPLSKSVSAAAEAVAMKIVVRTGVPTCLRGRRSLARAPARVTGVQGWYADQFPCTPGHPLARPNSRAPLVSRTAPGQNAQGVPRDR
ncbi:hypothetical protein GCM10009801_01320 [Streptomyces albiaxialis]|uniref:Uncharacterized protein n=1 Tax=Streptomyces albiaxialis TaxID=329523 RepID=A0ABN2VDS6_9ACTN